MRALTVYLSGEKHMYVCIYLPVLFFRAYTHATPEETRIQLEALPLFAPSRSWISIWFQIAQVHVCISDSRAQMTTYVCRSGGPGNKAGGCSDRERAR